ncbi:hypothetical protein KY285_001678 [Solanum tuberosum]|nr:hypothetical protein KY284_001833 [Solanum tuberosum]KAH0730772.1 hypothetical protein KY289_001960 [Solanum tuberosum]KAH0765807.1 hypothetical protein KY285_001678 [Solanum tuberosum]
MSLGRGASCYRAPGGGEGKRVRGRVGDFGVRHLEVQGDRVGGLKVWHLEVREGRDREGGFKVRCLEVREGRVGGRVDAPPPEAPLPYPPNLEASCPEVQWVGGLEVWG